MTARRRPGHPGGPPIDPADAAPPIDDEVLPAGIGHDGTPRRVLCAAVVLFGERGFHGTSMRDLAERSGLRAPSIYEHFASKEALLSELMVIGRRTAVQSFDAALVEVGDSPLSRLDTVVAALVEVHTRHPMLMRVLTDDVHGVAAEVVAPAVELRFEMSLRLAQILVDGERAGVFRIPNLVPTVAAVHGLFIRIPHWFEPGRDYGMTELTRDYRALVASMLGVE